MNKMTVIQLLNKIANGEEVPKKIKYKGNILYYDDDYTKEYPPTFNYYDEKGDNSLIEGWLCQYINDEVEIIEEDKKIEKFDPCLGGIMGFEGVEHIFEMYADKINEIIDKLNKEEE